MQAKVADAKSYGFQQKAHERIQWGGGIRRDPKNRLAQPYKPQGAQKVAQIEILSESEAQSGWVFEAQVLDASGDLHAIRLSLDWSDYNLWSPDGGDTPSRVAEAVLAFLISKLPATEIRSRLDASMTRRLFDDADRAIPSLIQRPI